MNLENIDMEAKRMLDEARSMAGIPFSVCYPSPILQQVFNGFAEAFNENPCSAFDIAYNDVTQTFKFIDSLKAIGYDFSPGTEKLNWMLFEGLSKAALIHGKQSWGLQLKYFNI